MRTLVRGWSLRHKKGWLSLRFSWFIYMLYGSDCKKSNGGGRLYFQPWDGDPSLLTTHHNTGAPDPYCSSYDLFQRRMDHVLSEANGYSGVNDAVKWLIKSVHSVNRIIGSSHEILECVSSRKMVSCCTTVTFLMSLFMEVFIL